ncbi:PREDICTED: uncharacterized protein LOC108359771 [Rhagoletis zephyria]|uniref:uncharacterized protein LOC108359771 n=1 Tax=Rhagoletis zephyria TaxID=28612 RepID=UPI0008117C08|nr:PREDICTED: uncharacterized protein LOC108359771 [Rhagoletis zephyria]
MPQPGQPGSLDDRLREGLSGSGVKWYLRYLGRGKPLKPEPWQRSEWRLRMRDVKDTGKATNPHPPIGGRAGPTNRHTYPHLLKSRRAGHSDNSSTDPRPLKSGEARNQQAPTKEVATRSLRQRHRAPNVSSSVEENGLRLFLGIDEQSYVSIKRACFNLNYRFSFVTTPTPASTSEPATTTKPAEDVPSKQELLSGIDFRRLELDRRSESELQLSDLEEPQL